MGHNLVVLFFDLCVIFGDVSTASVRLLGENSSQGRGELQLLDDSSWIQVCSGALDPIEAQLACRELGFSYVLRTGAVDELIFFSERPTITEGFPISVSDMDCSQMLAEEGVTPATLTLELCSFDFTFGLCDSTLHLECRNASVSEDYGLVVFTKPRDFWLIAPNINLTIECSSVEFYCEPVSLVPLTAHFFTTKQDTDVRVCENIDATTFLDLKCTPGEGDVCLRTRGGDCTDKGTVHFMKDGTLFGVCATSFGFFEAYVVCSQHGLSNLTYLGRRTKEDVHRPASVDCNGREDNLVDCDTDTMSTEDVCSDIAYLHCDQQTSDELTNTVLVGVSADPSAPFTVISPADGVYVDDCQPSRPLHCPGVYYMKRTLPSIQDIITELQVNQSCSQLGPIDLNITCSLSTTKTPQPTVLCDEGSNDVTCSSAPLPKNAVLLTFGVLIGVFAVMKIDLFTCTTCV